MTIASEITRINNNIAAAYTALSDKGATLPATQNSDNLADCVDSVSGGEIVTATNNTGAAIAKDSKVWVNTKELQATKIGSVAVNSSFTASNFSSDSYVKYVKSFDFSKAWEFKCKVFRNDVSYAADTAAFVYSAQDGSNESLYTAGFGLFLGTSFTFNFRDGGGNQLIAGGTVNVNTTYWIRCGWTGTEYYMDYSTDGTNYTSVGTFQSSSAITQTNTNIVIGASLWIPSFNWKGTIDLKEISMTIDDEVVWKGVADISPRLDDVDDTNIYTVTGVATENIAANGTGDVNIGVTPLS